MEKEITIILHSTWEFKNVKYPMVQICFNNAMTTYVGNDSMDDALMDSIESKDEYSRQAVSIDENIMYFIPDEVMTSSDEEIIDYIVNTFNPEPIYDVI